MPIRPLLLRPAFGAYWAGGLLSNTGTWLQNVSASIFIFTLTGSPLLVGVLNVATFAPILLFSPAAGTLSDLVDRRRVVVVTQMLSMLAAVGLTAMTAVGRATPALLIGAGFVLGTSYAFAKPALSSLLPALVAKEEIARATAVNTLQFAVGQILGSALASFLLAVAGPAWAFGVNAATFLGPTLAMAVIRLPPHPARSDGRRARGGTREGFRFLRSTDGLLAVLGMVVLANASTEALRTLAPSLTTTVLELEPSRAALLVTAYSAGSAVGLVLFGVVLRVLDPRRALAAAFGLQAAGVLGVALSPSFALTLVAAVPIGVGFSLAIPLLNSALQHASPEDFRGRVMAAFAMAHLGVRPAFALLAGALATVAGARVALLAFLTLALLALLLLRRTGSLDGVPPPAPPQDTERSPMPLVPGQTAPDFTLPGPNGQWSLSAQRGRPVVLYFYPKDGTPGCTAQACDVRDSWEEFTRLDVAVVGISPDPPQAHAAFAREYDLPQVLLSDEEHEVLETYGAWREKRKEGRPVRGVVRSAVVIDAFGLVAAVLDPIDPQEQARRALEVLAAVVPTADPRDARRPR